MSTAPDSSPLHTVLAHAERQRDGQLLAVQRALQALARAQAQGEQLRAYHAELNARLPGTDGRAVGIEQLRHHRSFAERLVQALAQQQEQVEAAQTRLETERRLLVELELRAASMRRLLERRDGARARHGAQREQRQGDDATAQRRLRTRSPLAPDTTY